MKRNLLYVDSVEKGVISVDPLLILVIIQYSFTNYDYVNVTNYYVCIDKHKFCFFGLECIRVQN